MTYEDFLYNEWLNPNIDSIEAQTSGSTGAPKAIRLDKRLVRDSAQRTLDFFGLNRNSWLHSCISPDFIGGKMMAVRGEIAKCFFSFETPSNHPIITPSQAKPLSRIKFPYSEISSDCLAGFPDLISVVPSQMQYIVENFNDIPTKSNFLVGGQAIHPELRKKIELSGLNAWETYGMTETASHIALRRVKENPQGFSPLPGITVATDERGCLTIELPHSPKIITNDLAEIHPDGTFSILGRADNVIISGGKKIIPEKVEAYLGLRLSHLGIIEIMLTSTPDEKWGEALTLLMESNEPIPNPEELCQTIKNIAKVHLMSHEVPKLYRFVDRLPRTSNGKLLRRTHMNH